MTQRWNNIDYAITALAGLTILLIGGVLTGTMLAERNGWDVFVRYGAIYQMARALTEAGVTRVLAQAVGQLISGTIWWAALLVLVFIYVYAHYAFATITAHVSAFYAAFLLVIIAAGAPPYLAVLSMSYVSSLGASLTHYGTTTSPIFFGAGYTTQARGGGSVFSWRRSTRSYGWRSAPLVEAPWLVVTAGRMSRMTATILLSEAVKRSAGCRQMAAGSIESTTFDFRDRC
jgi:hypothetical protein